MNHSMIDDITQFIFVHDTIKASDIIFIPGGSHPELGEEAANLYHSGYAPLIMPSGRYSIATGRFGGVKSKAEKYRKDYITECEFLTEVLLLNSVPPEAILGEERAVFTKENAYLSRMLADRHGLRIKTAILCCKNYHARRALMFYQFAFPDVTFMVHPIPYYLNGTTLEADNWHTTSLGIKRVLGELKRLGEQFNDEFTERLP